MREVKPFEKVGEIRNSYVTYKYYDYTQYSNHKDEMLKNGYREINQMSLEENDIWCKFVEYKEIPFHERNFSNLDWDNNESELQEIMDTMASNPLQWVIPRFGAKARQTMGELFKYNYKVFYEVCDLLITPIMESHGDYEIFGENLFNVILSNVNKYGILENDNYKMHLSNEYGVTVETDYYRGGTWGSFTIDESGY
jgi:hypothetical protein